MFRKQVNPKVAAVTTVLVLVIIQATFWRLLVYTPPPNDKGKMMGGGAPRMGPPVAMGLKEVQVENWAGEHPGYRDGPGWDARFSGPNALALEPSGAVLVADSRNHCLRRITPSGVVSTVAGGDPHGAGSSALGAASAARFRLPSGVAVAPNGDVYLADTGNHRICRIAAGQVTLLAGGARGRRDGAGTAASFDGPGPLAVDPDGTLWVADLGNRVVRRVRPNGIVDTPAQPSGAGQGLGSLRRAPGEQFLGTGTGLEPVGPMNYQVGRRSPGFGVGGAQLFTDVTNHLVLAQRPGEPPILLAGRFPGRPQPGAEDGGGDRSTFASPAAIVARPDGTAYVADYDGNRIRRIHIPERFLQ